MAGKYKNLVGEVFGKFKVISRAENNKPGAYWECLCECGKTVERSTMKLNLKSGPTCACEVTVYDHEGEKRTGIKTCRTCKEDKPFSEYPIAQKTNGIAHDCKACQSIKTKLRYFGITQEQFYKLREDAGDCCEICGITEKEALENNNKTKHYGLYIDHNHSTGNTRGMLCHNCNLIIGHAKDNTSLLLAAVSYLEREEIENKN